MAEGSERDRNHVQTNRSLKALQNYIVVANSKIRVIPEKLTDSNPSGSSNKIQMISIQNRILMTGNRCGGLAVTASAS